MFDTVRGAADPGSLAEQGQQHRGNTGTGAPLSFWRLSAPRGSIERVCIGRVVSVRECEGKVRKNLNLYYSRPAPRFGGVHLFVSRLTRGQPCVEADFGSRSRGGGEIVPMPRRGQMAARHRDIGTQT